MKGMAIHLVLATLGLGLAYRAWTLKDEAEDTGSSDSVMLAECGVDDFESVSLTEPNRSVTLTKKTEGGAEYYWATSSLKVGATDAAKDPHAPEAEAPKADTERAQQFAVGKNVSEYIDALLPFRAKRSLGALSPAQLKETKLDKPESSFTLACGGKKVTYELGAPAFGSGDYYFRAKGDSTVYLVSKSAVSELSRAESTLMRRDLFGGDLKEVEHLVVRAEGAEKKLLQRNRLDEKQAEWVDSAQPDVRNELYGNWFAKVKQLRVEKYLAPGQEPGQDLTEPKPSVKVGTLEYLDKAGKRLELVEIAVVDQEIPAYYAKSGATHSWVRVLSSIGKQVASDLAPVLGLESSAQ